MYLRKFNSKWLLPLVLAAFFMGLNQAINTRYPPRVDTSDLFFAAFVLSSCRALRVPFAAFWTAFFAPLIFIAIQIGISIQYEYSLLSIIKDSRSVYYFIFFILLFINILNRDPFGTQIILNCLLLYGATYISAYGALYILFPVSQKIYFEPSIVCFVLLYGPVFIRMNLFSSDMIWRYPLPLGGHIISFILAICFPLSIYLSLTSGYRTLLVISIFSLVAGLAIAFRSSILAILIVLAPFFLPLIGATFSLVICSNTSFFEAQNPTIYHQVYYKTCYLNPVSDRDYRFNATFRSYDLNYGILLFPGLGHVQASFVGEINRGPIQNDASRDSAINYIRNIVGLVPFYFISGLFLVQLVQSFITFAKLIFTRAAWILPFYRISFSIIIFSVGTVFGHPLMNGSHTLGYAFCLSLIFINYKSWPPLILFKS